MRDECCEVYRVNEYGTFISADLGGSSIDSNKIFED